MVSELSTRGALDQALTQLVDQPVRPGQPEIRALHPLLGATLRALDAGSTFVA